MVERTNEGNFRITFVDGRSALPHGTDPAWCDGCAFDREKSVADRLTRYENALHDIANMGAEEAETQAPYVARQALESSSQDGSKKPQP